MNLSLIAPNDMNFLRKLSVLFTFGILVFSGSFVANLENAQSQDAAAKAKMEQIKAQAKAELNQLPSTKAEDIIGLAIRVLMWFMGAIMFALVAYAGALWMTAGGNTEKIGKAKNILVWSALGVSVMLLSYVIVNFVFSRIEQGGV